MGPIVFILSQREKHNLGAHSGLEEFFSARLFIKRYYFSQPIFICDTQYFAIKYLSKQYEIVHSTDHGFMFSRIFKNFSLQYL